MTVAAFVQVHFQLYYIRHYVHVACEIQSSSCITAHNVPCWIVNYITLLLALDKLH